MTLIKTSSLSILPLLGLPFLASQEVGTQYEIKFAPAADLSITKTFSSITRLDSDEIIFAIDGDKEALPPADTTTEIEQDVTITDLYVESKDGRPVVLSRTFGEIDRIFTMAVGIGPETANPTGEGKSSLTGATVTFTRDADAESYRAEFTGDERREAELLDGLVEDMDMRALLPAEALEVGSRYTIEPVAFMDVLHAGGNLTLEMEVEGYPGALGLEPHMTTDYRSFFGDVKEAQASGKLMEVVEVEGQSIAVIELSLSMVGIADHSEAHATASNEGRPAESQWVVNQCDLKLACDGEGVLRWNLDRGVMQALDFTGDLVMDTVMDMAVDSPTRKAKLDLTSSQSGDVTIKVRVR